MSRAGMCRVAFVLAVVAALSFSSSVARADEAWTEAGAVLQSPAGWSEQIDPDYAENHAVLPGSYDFTAKASAAVDVLKAYASGSYSHMNAGTGDPSFYYASTSAAFLKPIYIQVPDAAFWTEHEAYLLTLNFSLSGTLSKTEASKIEFSYEASRHFLEQYSRMIDCGTYDYGTTLTNAAHSVTADATWNLTGEFEGDIEFDSTLILRVMAEGMDNASFSVTADFFNTGLLNSISLLSQDGTDDPELVVKFDPQGNILDGDEGFTLGAPVPEPATLVLVLGGLLPLLARRVKRA
jgi:hypothetical protein